MRLYRLLLRLLPRRRRDRYGDEMAQVFDEQRQARGRTGRLAASAASVREAMGLMKFAMRERSSSWPRFSAPAWRSEVRWAWRGLRARGGTPLVTVALLAVAMSANAVVFAVTDALVFKRVPYADADRLVEIQRISGRGQRSGFLRAETLDRWRDHTDLFSGVEGHLNKVVFMTHGGRVEAASIADVTPGLTTLLGVAPGWGRPLHADDADRTDGHAVLIAESLARELFGDPAGALGQTVRTSDQPLVVVGVMATPFRFPNGAPRIWRVLDPHGPLARGFAGVSTVARLAPGVSAEHVNRELSARAHVVSPPGPGSPETFALAPLPMANPRGGELMLFLMAAALCLLLTACANVVSVEIAASVRRARVHAVQLALGATRASLARIVLLEGALLVSAATAAGAALAWALTRAIEPALPAAVRLGSAAIVAIDVRDLGFMAIIATLTWLVAALPLVWRGRKANLAAALQIDGRGAASSRAGSRVRRLLTAAQVGLAVLLLSCSLIALRTFAAMAATDKGFVSRNLVSLGISTPLSEDRTALSARLLEVLRDRADVEDVSLDWAPPMFGSPFSDLRLEIDAGARVVEGVSLSPWPVSDRYFPMLGMAPIRGRLFRPGEPNDVVVLPERFARTFFGETDPIGREIRWSAREPARRVIGVVPDIRTERELMTGIPGRSWYVFTPTQPPRPRPPAADNGGGWGVVSLLMKTRDGARLDDLQAAAQQAVPEYAVSMARVDDGYLDVLEPLRVATAVVNAFGVLSLVVAAAGIYAVMAFFVAARTREIGIRVALGAGSADVRALVLGSSLRFVIAGAALGLATAVALAAVVRSWSTAVDPLDWAPHAGLLLVVLATALLATWHPARQAARIDPAITLRAE